MDKPKKDYKRYHIYMKQEEEIALMFHPKKPIVKDKESHKEFLAVHHLWGAPKALNWQHCKQMHDAIARLYLKEDDPQAAVYIGKLLDTLTEAGNALKTMPYRQLSVSTQFILHLFLDFGNDREFTSEEACLTYAQTCALDVRFNTMEASELLLKGRKVAKKNLKPEFNYREAESAAKAAKRPGLRRRISTLLNAVAYRKTLRLHRVDNSAKDKTDTFKFKDATSSEFESIINGSKKLNELQMPTMVPYTLDMEEAEKNWTERDKKEAAKKLKEDELRKKVSGQS